MRARLSRTAVDTEPVKVGPRGTDTPPMAATRSSRGFTLVELLVVVTILGIVTSVVVFAVQGSTTSADQASCAADAQTLTQAEEVHRAREGSYASEAALVSAELLRSPSDLHEVELDGDTYVLVGVGECAVAAEADTETP